MVEQQIAPLIKPANEETGNSSNLIQIIAIALILFGLFARFANLSTTPIWKDELDNILHMGGYTRGEVEQIIKNRIVEAKDLSDFRARHDSDRDSAAVITAVKYDSAEHPPNYCLLGHYWLQHFGDRDQNLRWLSAGIGVLQIPAAFWLGMELAGTASAGLIAAALICASPLATFYSQEIKEYSIYILMTLLASAALLRANRFNRWIYWVLYSVCCICGTTFSGLFTEVIFAHGCYMLIRERSHTKFSATGLIVSSRLLQYCLATLAALIFCSPWVLSTVLPMLPQEITRGSNLRIPPPPGTLMNAMLFNAGAVFYWIRYSIPAAQNCVQGFLLPFCVLWTLIAWRRSRDHVFLFLICFFAPVLLFFWLPDLILHTQLSTYLRYYLLVPLSMLLIATYSFDQHWHAREPGLRVVAFVGFVFAVFCQISSDLALLTLKDREIMAEQPLSAVADIIQHHPGTLIVSAENGQVINSEQLMTLSYVVPDSTKFLWLDHPTVPPTVTLPEQFYIFSAPGELLGNMKKSGYKLLLVPKLPFLLQAIRSKVPSATQTLSAPHKPPSSPAASSTPMSGAAQSGPAPATPTKAEPSAQTPAASPTPHTVSSP